MSPSSPKLPRRRWMSRPIWSAVAATLVGSMVGCTEDAARTHPTYATLPARQVPVYMKDSVYEATDMSNTEPAPISGYGLVANLRGTGGCRAPTPVRDYMVKELARHHVGTQDTGFESPDKILNSKNFSIVKVEGYIPPGARVAHDRQGQLVPTWFDVRVAAVPESDTTSLAHGDLYACDLKIGGANPTDPGNGKVDVLGEAGGSIFVNPTYVTDTDTDTPAARASRRSGFVLAGGQVTEDRPLVLRLRAPERRMARAIERRINERFQDVADDDLQDHGNSAAKKIANAQDEALINVYVPLAFGDHWDHFAGVIRHLYIQGGDPAFAALKARQLADAATLPDAKLLDISYAWEGLGKPALHALQPLMTDPMPVERKVDGKVVETRMEHHPDVRFAAVRAAAYIGDPAAVPALGEIASTVGDPFRVNAIEALSELHNTPLINALVRPLLNSDEATVRIAAYRLLSQNHDPSIYTRWVRDGEKEIFALDVVRGAPRLPGQPGGKPLVYATQQGVPRLAVFGSDLSVDLPMIFSALEDGRLMLSTTPANDALTISYRSPYRKKLIGFTSGPDLPELIAHLGGDGNTTDTTAKLHLSYGDVVAVVQQLIAKQKISGTSADGTTRLAATFVLGDPSMAVRLPVDTSRLIRRSAAGGRAVADEKPVTDDDKLVRPQAPTPGLTESDAAAQALANQRDHMTGRAGS